MRAEVLLGDAAEALSTLPDACCDALVSDPPAGVAFMGKDWDGHKGGRDQWIAWLAGIMAEARRCVRPGGYALVWALPRTSHWTATALDDGGWRIIDIITHHFGQGFPKGKGQLKPASEHWILCRAPGPTRPLQIDACRVGVDDGSRNRPPSKPSPTTYAQDSWTQNPANRGPFQAKGAGRWPPNTLLSHVGGPDGCQPAGVRRVRVHWSQPTQGRRGPGPRTWGYADGAGATCGYADAEGYETVDAWTCHPQCPIRVLDEQAGPRTSGGYPPEGGQRSRVATYGQPNERGEQRFTASTGSASRFFPTFPGPDPEDAVPFRYEPKASRRDRGEGNTHSTVKPTNLMAWLCKIVTPQGGVVLDCFAGSGSTGVACVREGFGFIGIEAEASYVDIARRRIAHEQEQRSGPLFAGVGTATSAAR